MKKTPQRHFPYQHPTFGTDKRPKRPWFWEDTVYFYWWSYLKRNEEYIQTCEQSGAGTLSKLYSDFGDVRGDSFKVWWKDENRGVRLFAEPEATTTLREVSKDEINALEGEQLLIAVPLNLPKKFLLARFRSLLADRKEGGVGRQYAKRSRAKYQFKGQPNIKALRTTLEVYDFIKANPKKKLWEVGKILPQFQIELDECEKKGEVPSYHLKRTIEATVSRYKRKATQTVKNVSLGVFP